MKDIFFLLLTLLNGIPATVPNGSMVANPQDFFN